jgi:hypothetical protein
MAFPSGRAVRSYCAGLSHRPVSAAIANAGGAWLCLKVDFYDYNKSRVRNALACNAMLNNR